MNAQNAHEYLPLVQALADGKTIQIIDADGKWFDHCSPSFGHDSNRYRIKPEPRTFELYLNKDTGVFLDANGIELINFPEYERITVQEVLQ